MGMGYADTTGGGERRLHARFDVQGLVLCELRVGERTFYFVVEDVSQSGLRIRTVDLGAFDALEAGDGVDLCLEGQARDMFTRTKGTVVWSALVDGSVVVGIRFFSLLPPTLEEAVGKILDACGAVVGGPERRP